MLIFDSGASSSADTATHQGTCSAASEYFQSLGYAKSLIGEQVAKGK